MKERNLSSHYDELVDNVLDKDKLHLDGIAVSTIPSLMERTDGPSVFEEGEQFSGFEVRGSAEACITTVASPYVHPTTPRDEILQIAEKTIGQPINLPEGLSDLQELPLHLIVWWRHKKWDDDGQAGILRVVEEGSLQEQKDFCETIAAQTARATRIIHEASGRKPLIQSSWGHATPDERAMYGKSRGGPSNKHGHLHVLDLVPEEQNIEHRKDLLHKEKLNHFGPWNSLVHESLSVPIARAIGLAAQSQLPHTLVTAEDFSEVYRGANNAIAYRDGYRLVFDQPTDLSEVFGCLMEIAGVVESFYQEVGACHADYYKYSADSNIQVEAIREITNKAIRLGFTSEEAERFTTFSLRIRPTYGQLKSWQQELETHREDEESLRLTNERVLRYERTARILGASTTRASHTNLIKDMVTPTKEFRDIQSVWPVHMGACFIIGDYEFDGNQIAVKSMEILPNIDTIKGVEYITGTLLKRAKGNAS
jgi:hypothetical protein